MGGGGGGGSVVGSCNAWVVPVLRGSWTQRLAMGHPLPVELAEAFTLKMRSKEEGFLFWFFFSFYLKK